MTGRYVVGVDPGRTVGLCVLDLVPGDDGQRIYGEPWLIQATPAAAEFMVIALVNDFRGAVLRIAVEQYVSGPRSARTRDRGAQDETRRIVANLSALAYSAKIPMLLRPAGHVKPWATDKRLHAAGIRAPAGTGYRHALDAGRMALYSAVNHCGVPDPLSGR